MSYKRILHAAKIVTPVVVGISAALTNPYFASANPAGVGDATHIIAEIEARGDRVIISKTGNKQLPQCTVAGVRQGPAVYRSAPASPFGTNSPVRNVAYRIFFVDVKC